ncbi:hypothetical protein [Peribacillus muralis]|uniref:hypothetical protein n=1 Tax=Peribacillus muralis TaxID=264697 RepID=UPI00366F5074
MYAIIHVPTQKVIEKQGVFAEIGSAKKSYRHKAYMTNKHEYGVAEISVQVKEETIEQVNPVTDKWEKVNE